MSGAAVFTHGHLIGVIRRHNLAEGPGRLVVEPLTATATSCAQLSQLLDDGRLTNGLPDAIPADLSVVTRAVYHRQIQSAAPEKLLDRDTELGELLEFCAAPGGNYLRIEAGYRAGKTALTSWYATHPPAGLDIAAFLIMARASDQADADAFLAHTSEQLSLIVPTPAGEAGGPRTAKFQLQLDQAAERLADQGRRLVLVVDGTDEDTASTIPRYGQESILGQLPRRPHPNLRIIIAGRPNPGIPADVADDHPIRTCPTMALTPSPEAQRRGREADLELAEILHEGGIGVDIVAYTAAAGGGLTIPDLSSLTNEPPYRIRQFLNTRLARCFESRPSGDPDQPSTDPDTQTWQFIHDTIRDAAETNLGTPTINTYRHRIHTWIQDFSDCNWPADTPHYAATAYPNLLTQQGDRDRLHQLATNTHRHTWLQATTGTDHTAHQQIRATQQQLRIHPYADFDSHLTRLLTLTVYSHQLLSHDIPPRLPVLWAQIGRPHHAIELARTITEPSEQDRTHAKIAEIIASNDPNRAIELARTITEPSEQDRTHAEPSRVWCAPS